MSFWIVIAILTLAVIFIIAHRQYLKRKYKSILEEEAITLAYKKERKAYLEKMAKEEETVTELERAFTLSSMNMDIDRLALQRRNRLNAARSDKKEEDAPPEMVSIGGILYPRKVATNQENPVKQDLWENRIKSILESTDDDNQGKEN